MNLKILIAADKYKGSLSALKVCTVIKDAILGIDKNIDVVVSPMADGGDGTVETLVESQKGRFVDCSVRGPLGKPLTARFGMIRDNIAVIEMASASGLVLVPEGSRDPMETSTYGTGELILKALEMGAKKMIIGIGGSATNDGGMGMAQALGIKFFDSGGKLLGPEGKSLQKLASIDIKGLHPAVSGCKFEVASDVDNPLTGKNGAAYVYAPQKGADENMVKLLDNGLSNLAKVILEDLGKDIEEMKGAGAAGGLGAGLVAFLDAELSPGTDIVISATSLEDKIKDVDLVITGEGAMDRQTFFGKSSYGVARLAKKYKKTVITINGSVFAFRDDIKNSHSSLFDGNFSIINKPMILKEAMSSAGELLKEASTEIINFYLNIKKS